MDVARYWIAEFGIDGIRFDYAQAIYLAGHPPFVGHVVVKRRRRGELQELDLQRLPGLTAAPGPLQHLSPVLRDKVQDLILVGGKSVRGTGPRPEQDAERQAHHTASGRRIDPPSPRSATSPG